MLSTRAKTSLGGPLGELGGLRVAGINFADTATNVATLLAGSGTRLALPDRDPSQHPFAAATADFAGSRPLAAASRTQKPMHGASVSGVFGPASLICIKAKLREKLPSGSKDAAPTWHSARNWRFRAEEIRTLAADMMQEEPKAIMLRIVADYEKLAEWAERYSKPWPKNLTDRGRGAALLIDLVHVVRLFAEDCQKPKVVCFRPLAAVLNEPAVEKLRAARHEFRWSNEAELVSRKHEGWWLVLGCDSNNKERPAIFMDCKEELVLLHRRSRDSKAGISIKYNSSHPA